MFLHTKNKTIHITAHFLEKSRPQITRIALIKKKTKLKNYTVIQIKSIKKTYITIILRTFAPKLLLEEVLYS